MRSRDRLDLAVLFGALLLVVYALDGINGSPTPLRATPVRNEKSRKPPTRRRKAGAGTTA
jgi:hypothetical protein